jgi:hypothetical protein
MDCLIDYIGIREVAGTVPESGVYINSLPGISTEVIQLMADGEQITYKGVWDDVQTMAAKRLYADLIAKLKAKYKINSARYQVLLDPAVGVNEAAEAKIKGVMLTYGWPTISLQGLYLQAIYLNTRNAGTTTMYVMDEQGYTLYEEDVAFDIGFNSFMVGRFFSSEALFVGFDMTGVDGYVSETQTLGAGIFAESVKSVCASASPAFSGQTFDTFYTDNGANTHGVGAAGYVTCRHEAYVCYNKELFTSAWMLLLGNQLMAELLATSRVNSVTTIDRGSFEGLRDVFQADYEKQLEAVITGIDFDPWDCCMECVQVPKRVTWLP